MSRCELTGKGPVVKNKVSHSNIKTKSVALPNVQLKRVFSGVLKQFVCLRMATSTMRSMEHVGNFDMYILRMKTEKMSKRALEVRNRIRRQMKTKLEKGEKS